MPRPAALACISCGADYPLTHYADDCPACRGAGVPSNLTVRYAETLGAALRRDALPAGPNSLWRFADFLPLPASDAITLGEGATPLHDVAALGLGPVWVKDESRNPTWSFKDRLACLAVSMARALGATVIASSSSGNAGAATAAYAARAGLPCVVFTTRGAVGPMVTQMRAYGAMVFECADRADRWTLVSAGVKRFGWYPTTTYFGPAVGSNPYGIEGYKTIAYEIAEQCGWAVPDWCVLPVCYGDALYGMWKGFEELRALGWIDRVPRLAAAEVSGSLAAALATGAAMPPVSKRNEPTIAGSIGADQGTVQGLDALRRTDGAAVTIDNAEMEHWQARLARATGLYAEPASVAPFAAIARLRAAGTIAAGARVVVLLTAGGLKDPATTDRTLGAAPGLADGDFDAACRALKTHYGFDPHA
ncbi:MAG: pyridoxal-phosphate dependent enzyme [Proteobacteria bacterium]|nr:pyridoxal-phosphate dependent enzyme [Pseudomonadota bacterium]